MKIQTSIIHFAFRYELKHKPKVFARITSESVDDKNGHFCGVMS
jgi:hypothetical protein